MISKQFIFIITIIIMIIRVKSSSLMWVGGVTHNSARFVTSGYSDREFRLGTSRDLSDSNFSFILSKNPVASFEVHTLRPLTTYYYGFVDGDKGTFKTFNNESFSFKVAFGSCSASGSTAGTWSDLSEHKPDIFVHLGDLHYDRISINDTSLFEDSYRAIFDSSPMKGFFHSTSFAYTWGENDYGYIEDSDGNSDTKIAARVAYQTMIPHYPFGGAKSGDVPIYQAFTIGNVRFILPDLRSEAFPLTRYPTGKIMSDEQLAWLLSELGNWKNYSMVVLASSRAWIGESDMQSQGWFGWPTNRETVANFIAENEISNLVILAGGARIVAIDNGRNSDYATNGSAGIPVFQAGPLDRWGSTGGGPYSEGCYAFLYDYTEQYGIMEISDDGDSNPCFTWNAYQAGNPTPLMTLHKCGKFRVNGDPGNQKCLIPLFSDRATIVLCFAIGIFLFIWVANSAFFCTTKGRMHPWSVNMKIGMAISILFVGIVVLIYPILLWQGYYEAKRPVFLPTYDFLILVGGACVYGVISTGIFVLICFGFEKLDLKLLEQGVDTYKLTPL